MSGKNKYSGSYYVYALLDPRTDSPLPFYIGKGVINRANEHVRSVSARMQSVPERAYETSGVAPEDVLNLMKSESRDDQGGELASRITIGRKLAFLSKSELIEQLIESGFQAKDIVRVLARNLEEDVALAIEALLIKSVYGKGNLANKVEGHHAERFRTIGEWGYIPGYDVPCEGGNFSGDEGNHPSGTYYVYVLRVPDTGEIFYVGKGRGKRLSDHFKHALKDKSKQQGVERLEKIRSLIARGYNPSDIGRVVARVDSESTAFMVEAFYMKYVVGFKSLKNIQPGHEFENFRSKRDWVLRPGFDLQIVVKKGSDRTELLHLFLGEGLHEELYEVVRLVKENYPELQLEFGEARLFGAGELIVSSAIPGIEPISYENVRRCQDEGVDGFVRLKPGHCDSGVRIRIQTRVPRAFQVFLFAGGSEPLAKVWYEQHFKKLGAWPVNRQDHQYRPDPWHATRGSIGVTYDHAEAARRVMQLVHIARAASLDELSDEERALLVAEERVRELRRGRG